MAKYVIRHEDANANTFITDVASGGTGADSAAGARTNLDVPPTSHAAVEPLYGAASGAAYGHVLLSDTPASADTATTGKAASPAAVAAVLPRFGTASITTAPASGSGSVTINLSFPAAAILVDSDNLEVQSTMSSRLILAGKGRNLFTNANRWTATASLSVAGTVITISVSDADMSRVATFTFSYMVFPSFAV